ncbi:MAG: Uma2 family endonuclease [Gammaproteobacteria bacterium]|nr:Uma2 family endonuclease [Gammaproteobacteria bacterium]
MRRREQPNPGADAAPNRANVPTTPPHPLPGGEYDRDGFLYKCPVENFRHEIIRTELAAILRPRIARLHGDRAVVASDVGLYPRPEDRFGRPLAPDILVSLTAGDIDAPGTPPAPDRMSYKLWQEPVPDLVIEIVSFGSGERDTVDKPNRYEAIGIPEYWIFDPERHRIAHGLGGRLLANGVYAAASPVPPAADEVPVPAGAVPYWSAVLGLYLYADGKSLRLHDPATGRINNVEEEIAAREAAETRAARATARADALEAELKALRQRQ